MKSCKIVNEYILNAPNNRELLIILRNLLKESELIETIKWGIPVYTLNEKNVVGLAAFKSYVGLWFFQGALLKDHEKVLINAQEDKTKAQRQWRFKLLEDINGKLISKYIREAIDNQKKNKEIKPNRSKPITIPEELKETFLQDRELESRFSTFTKGKQREFANYISEAKRTETRQKRLKKIIPLIQQNIGLNDKYRK